MRVIKFSTLNISALWDKSILVCSWLSIDFKQFFSVFLLCEKEILTIFSIIRKKQKVFSPFAWPPLLPSRQNAAFLGNREHSLYDASGLGGSGTPPGEQKATEIRHDRDHVSSQRRDRASFGRARNPHAAGLASGQPTPDRNQRGTWLGEEQPCKG